MIEEILNEVNKIPSIRGSVVIGKDGIPIKSNLMSDVDETKVSAMIASMSKDIENSLRQKTTGHIFVSLYTTDGDIFFVSTKECILAVVTGENINVGSVRIALTKHIKKIVSRL